MRKENKAMEYITGAAIGIGFGIIFFHKLIFGAELTSEEKIMIAQTIECEAGNQSIEGKRYVAAVILNRLGDPTFPDTVSDVLSQPNQFSTYPELLDASPTWQDELALRMELETRSDEEIVFFRAGRYGCGQPKFKFEDHYFSVLADDDKKMSRPSGRTNGSR